MRLEALIWLVQSVLSIFFRIHDEYRICTGRQDLSDSVVLSFQFSAQYLRGIRPSISAGRVRSVAEKEVVAFSEVFVSLFALFGGSF